MGSKPSKEKEIEKANSNLFAKSSESDDEESHPIFSNLLILQRIFRFLDLSSLKNVRLVNRTWASRAVKKFDYNTNILINVNSLFPLAFLSELENFILKHAMRHALMLSFLKPSWVYNCLYYSAKEEKSANKKYHKRNNTNFSSMKMVNKILSFLGEIGSLVYELRFEMVLKDEKDAKLLCNVLSRCQRVEKVHLDFVVYTAKGMLSLQNCLPSSTHTLGLRFNYATYAKNPSSITTLNCSNVMSKFSKIVFLDLSGWSQMIDVQSINVSNWLKAMCLISEKDSTAFSNLKGIRMFLGEPEEADAFLAFPKSLEKIYLDCCPHTHSHVATDKLKLSQIGDILKKHSETLIDFDFQWHETNYPASEEEETEPYCKIELPFMPKLQSLGLTFYAKLEEKKGWTSETLDPFSLRKTFMEGTFLLPSLTTLCLCFYFEESPEIWKHIFPDIDSSNQPLQILNVQNVMISLDAECDSLQIKRLQKIFPALKMLRHVKRNGLHLDFVTCEHRYNKCNKNLEAICDLQRPYRQKTQKKVETYYEKASEETDNYEIQRTYSEKMHYLLRIHKSAELCFWL